MTFGWIGFHAEGLGALRAVLARKVPIQAVVTLHPSVASSLSGAVDYRAVCGEYGVPLHFVRDINDDDSLTLLGELSLDVAFVIGWTQMIGRKALALARTGMIGAHASLLPRLRGRAPINWALIRGLQQTGNSLMWLAERPDRGDIIDQTVIPITPYDTCASLYDKVAESNTLMILGAIPALLKGDRPGRPQPSGDERDLPRRRPQDGLLEWSRSSREVYDFVRAVTKPYPGAFSWLDGRRYIVWQAALLPAACDGGSSPGEILGPVVSPRSEACGLAVACGSGAMVLLELEDEDGQVLAGSLLSDQAWTGKRWTDKA